jgi:uncharacterized protein
MKYIAILLLAVLVGSQGARAQEAQASAETVKQLFQAMHTSKIIDTLMTQTESTVRTSMQQAVAGQQLNAAQQKIVDDLQHKMFALVKEQLNWADLEPMMVDVYRSTFTQHEIDGMLKFYRSSVGQAVVAKIPAATQESMARIQGRLQSLTPRIMQLEQDAAAQLKAAASPAPAPVPAPATPPH